jgi:hypothetical protein
MIDKGSDEHIDGGDVRTPEFDMPGRLQQAEHSVADHEDRRHFPAAAQGELPFIAVAHR